MAFRRTGSSVTEEHATAGIRNSPPFRSRCIRGFPSADDKGINHSHLASQTRHSRNPAMRIHLEQVDLLGDRLRISYDGEQVIEQNTSLIFKGGYMFFSGSTGAATNEHRFDDLRILHQCQ